MHPQPHLTRLSPRLARVLFVSLLVQFQIRQKPAQVLGRTPLKQACSPVHFGALSDRRNGGAGNCINGTEFANPPQDARDGASRHAHPRSLDAEPCWVRASGAWWSSKLAHANGVPFIFNLVGSGSDHPVNPRYEGLRYAVANRELSRMPTHRQHGTPPDLRTKAS